MWVWAVFGVAAVAIWLLIMASFRLMTKFEYTAKSRLAIAACALLGIALGFYTSFRVFMTPSPFSWLLAPVYSFVFFVMLSSAACELWLRKQLARYDRQIEQLLEAEYRERSRLEEARDRVHNESLKRQSSIKRHREMVERRDQLLQSVERWQQAGGGARVRSLKVEEWRDHFSALDEPGLGLARERIKAELSNVSQMRDDASVERQSALRAELAVLDIQVIDRHIPREPDQAPVDEFVVRQEEAKSTLESIQHDLTYWRRKRDEFLAGKIRLE